jgi:hypothetical protein
MKFQIYPMFIDSLARLTSEEQKAVKIAALDLQMNQAQPSRHFYRLDGSKVPDFWVARANDDLRLIVHRGKSSLLFCYVDHHGKAENWARGHKLDTNTGVIQPVELREAVQEIAPSLRGGERPALSKPHLFAHIPERELLSRGVPPQWIPDVRRVTDENALLVLAERAGEAAEALLSLATVAKPNQGEERADLPECDWVYFATFPPEDFDATRDFVRKFRIIVRSAFIRADTRAGNVGKLQQGDTILLVHGRRGESSYRPVCSCTVVSPPRPVPDFDALSFADASPLKRLRNSAYTPDPHFGRFTGISIKESQNLEILACSISKPHGTNTICRWNKVFPDKG